MDSDKAPLSDDDRDTRKLYAAMALQGLLASGMNKVIVERMHGNIHPPSDQEIAALVAHQAFLYADAMLDAEKEVDE